MNKYTVLGNYVYAIVGIEYFPVNTVSECTRLANAKIRNIKMTASESEAYRIMPLNKKMEFIDKKEKKG